MLDTYLNGVYVLADDSIISKTTEDSDNLVHTIFPAALLQSLVKHVYKC